MRWLALLALASCNLPPAVVWYKHVPCSLPSDCRPSEVCRFVSVDTPAVCMPGYRL